jgi:hypothetical protein
MPNPLNLPLTLIGLVLDRLVPQAKPKPYAGPQATVLAFSRPSPPRRHRLGTRSSRPHGEARRAGSPIAQKAGG